MACIDYPFLATPPETVPAAWDKGEAMKILIVDDDHVSQVALSATLSRFGECTCESNGRDGVSRFTSSLDAGDPFDLVFMDIQMPIMDGQTALCAIRDLERERQVAPGKEVKAVMITCHDDIKNISTSFFRGQVTSYFTKPIDLQAMVEELQREGLV
jgi:two-component system chemotaxis response regulator CheY